MIAHCQRLNRGTGSGKPVPWIWIDPQTFSNDRCIIRAQLVGYGLDLAQTLYVCVFRFPVSIPK